MNNNNKDLLELEVEYQKDSQKQAPMLMELDPVGTSQSFPSNSSPTLYLSISK
jgi:hypothetical protein